MWVLELLGGQLKRLDSLRSEHISIFTEFNNSEVELYYFTSSHLLGIDKIEYYRAFYRAKALIRILNGTLLLTNSPPIVYNQQSIYYWEDKGNRRRSFPLITENMELEYEELQNIFQKDPSFRQGNERERNGYISDIFDLAYEDSLVKDVIMLFSLIHTDLLYILINTYKIIENIKFDLKTSGQDIGNLSENFQDAYNYFENNHFNHFSNTREGSGLFARHGANVKRYRKKRPSLEDINIYIRILIWEWINYKIENKNGYRHDPLYTQTSNIKEMRDEDYDFDL